MARWAEARGLHPLEAANADDAVRVLSAGHCDLAVIDVMMPGRNGLWLARELSEHYPRVAVILATGHVEEVEPAATAVADLLIKPFKRERFLLALDRGREWCRQTEEEIAWHVALTDEHAKLTTSLLNGLHELCAKGQTEEDALVDLCRQRIPDVAEHSERVVRYSLGIAGALNMSADRLLTLEQAARFHDIGKATTPRAVLTKPSPLTATESAMMRAHVDSGAHILQQTRTLADVAPIVLATHEWFGGRGYPRGLSGLAIPLEARIISVADAFDAMTEERQYRSRLSPPEAMSELLRSVPSQFDPEAVVAFAKLMSEH